jgi:hypothetical protein
LQFNVRLFYAYEIPKLCSISGAPGNGPLLVFMKNTQTFVLALLGLGSGAVLVIVEFTIRAQVNRRLRPEQRIGSGELQKNPYIWFGERGLLARHASLYPGSRLTTAFRVLWGTFWVLLAALILRA